MTRAALRYTRQANRLLMTGMGLMMASVAWWVLARCLGGG